MSNPSSVSELYPSKWVKAEDLAGRTATVKITAVTVETFRQPDGSSKHSSSFQAGHLNEVETFRQPDGSSKVSAVLSFEGKAKRMILNKTQCQALTDLTGSERFTDWVGRVITLAPATAQNGKPTIAIRPAPAQGVARPASEPARVGAGA
jgi:hypothetical protein